MCVNLKRAQSQTEEVARIIQDYHMGIFYHPVKVNMVVDGLSRLSMGSTTYVEEEKN